MSKLFTLVLLAATVAAAEDYPSLGDGLVVRGTVVDSESYIYLTGWVTGCGLSVINAHQSRCAGDLDAFIARLTPERDVIYATYLGGSGPDRAYGIGIDDTGNAYIVGETGSPDFPILEMAPAPAVPAAFIAKFSPSGTLLYSGFIGRAAS